MHRVTIYSDNQALIKLWSHALISHYDISNANDIHDCKGAAVVIVDSHKLDENTDLIVQFSNQSIRFLVVGKDWSEDKQISALVHGAAGYCGESEPPKLLLQAVKSVLKGDIWIQRHLVPRVIGTLVRMKSEATAPEETTKSIVSASLLDSLSSRERDVANMIRDGESNKKIAATLDISERTVKAHLTSTYKKLNVTDRLHLALYIKEYS
jgi:DNA-binding NarL/FixJ family response regulator